MLTFQTKVQAWVPTLFMINFYTCQLSCYNFSWPFWIVSVLADTGVTKHHLQWEGWADIGGMFCVLNENLKDPQIQTTDMKKWVREGGGAIAPSVPPTL